MQKFPSSKFHFPNFLLQFASVFGFSSKLKMSQIPRPRGGIPVRSGIPRPASRIPQSAATGPSGIARPTLLGKSVQESIAAHKLKQQNAQIIKQRGTYGNVVRGDQLLNAPKVVTRQQVGQNMKDYGTRMQQKKLEGIVKKYGAQPLPNTDCTLLPPFKLQSTNNFFSSHPSRHCTITAYSSKSSPASRHTKQDQREAFRSSEGGSKKSLSAFVDGNLDGRRRRACQCPAGEAQ